MANDVDSALDMLSSKEINEIAKSISAMSREIKETGKEMQKALDMSGISMSVSKYVNTLQNEVGKQFDSIFGKSNNILSIEEKRLAIIKEMGKALKSGNKE